MKSTGILIFLFAGVLMGALDISIVGPAIPSIEKTLHLNDKDLTWVYSIYILLNLVGISFMAKLQERLFSEALLQPSRMKLRDLAFHTCL